MQNIGIVTSAREAITHEQDMPAENQSGGTVYCPAAHGSRVCKTDRLKWIELLRQFVFFSWSRLLLHGVRCWLCVAPRPIPGPKTFIHFARPGIVPPNM